MKAFTYDYINKVFQDAGCILLSNHYKNCEQKLRYICNCGKISMTTLHKFKRGCRCKECGIKKYSKAIKYSLEEVKKLFSNRGCFLLSKNYKDNKQRLKFICSCGNKSRVSLNNFLNKKTNCMKCGTKKGAKKISGENHYLYRHDKSDEERINQRQYPEYRKWRTKVFENDNYTCQKCGIRGTYLIAHHIYSFANNTILRLVEDNGIPFCKSCHREYHNLFGYDANFCTLMEYLTYDKD